MLAKDTTMVNGIVKLVSRDTHVRRHIHQIHYMEARCTCTHKRLRFHNTLANGETPNIIPPTSAYVKFHFNLQYHFLIIRFSLKDDHIERIESHLI